MRKPFLAVALAVSAFAITAAGATGFSVANGTSPTVISIPGGTNSAAVSYDLVNGCGDPFSVDYTLTGDKSAIASLTVTESGDMCQPIPTTYLTFTGMVLTNGSTQVVLYETAGYSSYGAEDIQITGVDELTGVTGVDGKHRLGSWSGGDPNAFVITLPNAYTGPTRTLSASEVDDNVGIQLYTAVYTYDIVTEFQDATTDAWTTIESLSEQGDLLRPSITVDPYPDYALGGLAGAKQLRVTVTIAPVAA